jgi:PAS domain-containing protein
LPLIVPLPLQHSWPLPEEGEKLDLGDLFGATAVRGADFASLEDARLGAHGIGRWSCDLADNRLTWTDPVFDLFGLPRGATLSRDDVVALYCDGSRAAMNHLRSYAIRHRRGFTIDAEIRTVAGDRRWMRLLGAPICEGNRVIRLQGLKQDVTHHYQ